MADTKQKAAATAPVPPRDGFVDLIAPPEVACISVGGVMYEVFKGRVTVPEHLLSHFLPFGCTIAPADGE